MYPATATKRNISLILFRENTVLFSIVVKQTERKYIYNSFPSVNEFCIAAVLCSNLQLSLIIDKIKASSKTFLISMSWKL